MARLFHALRHKPFVANLKQGLGHGRAFREDDFEPSRSSVAEVRSAFSRISQKGFRLKTAQKFALASALVFAAGMWLYVERVLVPHQKSQAASQGVPRGNLSDLYPRWLGSRELLLNHRDPYSAEITREIQIGYYGRPLDGLGPEGPRDQQGFAYPVYVALLLAPTVKLPFPLVQELFRWLLAGLTVISVLLWMRFARLRFSWRNIAIVVLLTLGTFPSVQGIRLQQLSLLVAALIAGSAFLLSEDRQVLAGFLLAIATIKPQLAIPLAAWLLFWSLNHVRQRWKFAVSFAMTAGALIVAGEYMLPGWPQEFYAAVIAYRQYTRAQSVLDQLATPAIGALLAALVVAGVALICWRARSVSAVDEQFIWATSLVLAVTVVVIPTIAPYNQLLLLPGSFCLWRAWRQNLKVNSAIRILRILAAGCVIWPWVTVTILAMVSFFTSAGQHYWQLPLWTSFFIPITIAACLELCVVNKSIQSSMIATTEIAAIDAHTQKAN